MGNEGRLQTVTDALDRCGRALTLLEGFLGNQFAVKSILGLSRGYQYQRIGGVGTHF